MAAYARNEGSRVSLSAVNIGAILVIYLFLCLAVSGAAALVSLRAPTVRQAIQTLTWSFMIVFFLAIFAIARIPPEWRATLIRIFAGDHLLRTEIIATAILAGLAALLFGRAPPVPKGAADSRLVIAISSNKQR